MAFWSDIQPSMEPKQAHRWFLSFGDRNFNTGKPQNSIPHWVCKKVTKPSYTIKHTEHKYLGVHRFNYPTHLEWQPIQITLVDFFGFNGDMQDLFNFKTQKRLWEGKQDTSEEKEVNRSTQLFFYYFLRDAGYIDPNEREYKDELFRFTKPFLKSNIVGAFVGQNLDFTEANAKRDPKLSATYVDQSQWNTLDIIEVNSSGVQIEKWRMFNPLITSVKFGELSYESENIVDISVDLVYDWAEMIPVNTGLELRTFNNKSLEEKEKKILSEKKEYDDLFKPSIEIEKQGKVTKQISQDTKKYFDMLKSRNDLQITIEKNRIKLLSLIEQNGGVVNTVLATKEGKQLQKDIKLLGEIIKEKNQNIKNYEEKIIRENEDLQNKNEEEQDSYFKQKEASLEEKRRKAELEEQIMNEEFKKMVDTKQGVPKIEAESKRDAKELKDRMQQEDQEKEKRVKTEQEQRSQRKARKEESERLRNTEEIRNPSISKEEKEKIIEQRKKLEEQRKKLEEQNETLKLLQRLKKDLGK